ncbi:hypothetical protein CRUP_016568 [Coryphaenoides rupestris]|nr:hypothetical protein CRUP_016568 [Coryphaenoides rupestris]
MSDPGCLQRVPAARRHVVVSQAWNTTANPNYTTMAMNTYSGNNTNTTTTGGATGSLHVGLSSLLPSIMVAVSFLHRFC